MVANAPLKVRDVHIKACGDTPKVCGVNLKGCKIKMTVRSDKLRGCHAILSGCAATIFGSIELNKSTYNVPNVT